MKDALEHSQGFLNVTTWMNSNGNSPFGFQQKTWDKYCRGYSGIVVAPTGFGKTFSVFLGVLIDFMNRPDRYRSGLKLIWITPLRSLAKDLSRAMQQAIDEIGLDWTVEVRNGDTDVKVRQKQTRQMPDVLLVTPESLHLLLAQKKRGQIFKSLQCVVADEWHELLGSKRGVMTELALAYLRDLKPQLQTWGITATIGNLEEAASVLLPTAQKKTMITARERKKTEIITVFPDEVELLPWAGHLGSRLVDKVVPIILKSRSTLLFTNTRSQSENWYQLLLEAHPDFAGQIALHHSSIDAHLRQWIEEALSAGTLKAVIATSSLDLGVDFKPVDTVIQVGSSKGVARFIQRAGRSGHSPFETSKIYFVPTHSLELIEIAALKEAVKTGTVEKREPMVMTFDVLVQFLVTVALGGGFEAPNMFRIITGCHAFSLLTEKEWNWCLTFITMGGSIGKNYEEFHKVAVNEEDRYVVEKRRIAMIHRMNMGVIVSDAMMRVKFVSGGYIGMIEEYFISKLRSGDRFILSGRVLELVRTKEMTAFVRLSSGRAITPSWLGGRLPLSSNLSRFLREKLAHALDPAHKESELRFLHPLFVRQAQHSAIPARDEFLIEKIRTREGYHVFMYPFEGRLVHEIMASLIAYRISLLYPSSFSIAMNDYGFELFSDTEIPLERAQFERLLTKENLMDDVAASINATEMAKKKFRDIAVISGLVIQNLPGIQRNNKSLQASSGILFKVFEEYDPHNLLLRQAYTEVFNQQLEAPRLMAAFERIGQSRIIYKESSQFTPLSFPIKVDSLRQSLSSEDLAKRIEKLQKSYLKTNKKK